MPEMILKFDLDDADDRQKAVQAQKAHDLIAFIYEFKAHLSYMGGKESIPGGERVFFNECYNVFTDMLYDAGINIDELYS